MLHVADDSRVRTSAQTAAGSRQCVSHGRAILAFTEAGGFGRGRRSKRLGHPRMYPLSPDRTARGIRLHPAGVSVVADVGLVARVVGLVVRIARVVAEGGLVAEVGLEAPVDCLGADVGLAVLLLRPANLTFRLGNHPFIHGRSST